MYSEDEKDNDQRFALGVVATIISLIVIAVLTLGAYIGVSGSDAKGQAAAPATEAKADAHAGHATATNEVAPAAAAATGADEAKVVVENGVVKFYFATGKSDLAKGSSEALADVVNGVKDGKKAIISGYHDSTGSVEKNQELAKQRALSVRDTLVTLGVPADQIELKKPEQSQGSGSNAEARRVEVVLSK